MPEQRKPLDALQGRVIRVIELVGLIRIEFGQRGRYRLSIESAFEIVQRDGTSTHCRFDPASGERPSGLDTLGALYGCVVSEGWLDPDGSIRIAFENGAVLSVPVDPDYESGHLILGKQYIVVPPGGR